MNGQRAAGVVAQVALQVSAVALAFVLGFVLVLIFGYDPFEVYSVLFNGALGGLENVAWSLQNTTPLIFTGLAVALAFRAGLFNIGAEGQLVAGAFAAAVVGWAVPRLAGQDLSGSPFWNATWYPVGAGVVLATLLALAWTAVPHRGRPAQRLAAVRRVAGVVAALVAILYLLIPRASGLFLWVGDVAVVPLALVAAAVAGALWALIPALLRSRLGVSEVITTIMFNFLATLLASYLLTTTAFKEPGAVPQTPAVAPRAQLAELARFAPQSCHRDLDATQLNTGFVLALVVAILVAYFLWRTTLGFELRAVGANAEAARAQGISVGGCVVLTMLLSGALAGLGGAEQVLGVHHHFVKDFWVGLGFTGIAVALVGQNHPGGVVLAAILFGALQNGAVEIDMMTLFPRELILVLQALIIFLVASGPMLQEILLRRRR
ncbi:MAG: ABC transporter permease [Candidatus Riflebacteria bacterium]|nr:ABC transporter permease [Candidatus Riflebacteria bacterium]